MTLKTRRLLILLSVAGVFALPISPAQADEWTHQFGTSGYDWAYGVAVDGDGNVYVVGETTDTLPGQTSFGVNDAYLRKYNASGTILWTRQFGTRDLDRANGVAVDGDGNIYVVGATDGTLDEQSSAGFSDAFLRKYDAGGTVLWTRQFGTSGYDGAYGVAVDRDSTVYVAGMTAAFLTDEPGADFSDAFLCKYDASGVVQWTHRFGTESIDVAADVAVDGNGNIYVAGQTGGTFDEQSSAGMSNVFLRKYDASGVVQWTRQFGTTGDDPATGVAATGVAVAGDGSIYVVGYTTGTLTEEPNAGSYDAFLRGYDASGAVQWTQQFGTETFDSAADVAVDHSGTVYVVGLLDGSTARQSGSERAVSYVRGYDASGTLQWRHLFATADADGAAGVAVDGGGDVYVVGQTSRALTEEPRAGVNDVFVARRSPARAAGQN